MLGVYQHYLHLQECEHEYAGHCVVAAASHAGLRCVPWSIRNGAERRRYNQAQQDLQKVEGWGIADLTHTWPGLAGVKDGNQNFALAQRLCLEQNLEGAALSHSSLQCLYEQIPALRTVVHAAYPNGGATYASIRKLYNDARARAMGDDGTLSSDDLKAYITTRLAEGGIDANHEWIAR